MVSERPADAGPSGGEDRADGDPAGTNGEDDRADDGRDGADGGRSGAGGTDSRRDRTTEPEHDGTADEPSRRDLLSTVAAVGTAAGFAGCSDFDSVPGTDDSQGGDTDDPPDAARSLAAAPVGLPPAALQILGLTELRVGKLTRTVTPSDGESVAATSYLAVHGRPRDHEGPLPTRFGVPDLAARSFGFLSMPSPERAGASVDALATAPLGEALAGDRGKRLLQQAGVVETADFDWVRQPRPLDRREVELLGTETEGATVLGVAAVGDGPPTTVLANLARTSREGDVVLAAEFVRRRTPPGPLDREPPCLDDRCQLVDRQDVAQWREFQEVLKALRTCTEVTITLPGPEGTLVEESTTTFEVCGPPPGDEDGTTFDPEEKPPTFESKNWRVVQQVEETAVREPDGPPVYEVDDPPLVRGERSAAVFEFDTVENLHRMDAGPLTIEVYTEADDSDRSWNLEGSFELTESDLRDIAAGEPTLSVLHRISNDNQASKQVPVFELDTDMVRLSPGEPGIVGWDTAGLSVTFAVTGVEDLEPLRVGFVTLGDSPPGSKDPGDRYGNDRGAPVAYLRSAVSASIYLQRVLPGPVVSFVYTGGGVKGKGGFLCTDGCAIKRDLKRAKRAMDRIATDPSFPSNAPGFPDGGSLTADGLDRDRMVNEISSDGFDVVVAIVPRDYFDYWGWSDTVGVSFDASGTAVGVQGGSPSGPDVGVSSTAAHEVGHHFQESYFADEPGQPLAQRDDEGVETLAIGSGEFVDVSHARHQNSDNDDDREVDPPGVVSTGFDLTGSFDVVREWENPSGSFEVSGPESGTDSLPNLESYMSYTDREARVWTDAHIHQQLIDNGWNRPGSVDEDDIPFMLSGDGSVDDDGSIRFDEVTAFRGVREYTHSEDHPVQVELLDPDGGTLATARVPFREGVHDATVIAEEIAPAPSFRLPFAERGVRVRATYEDRTTELNPVERSVRDAVGRVPPEGFAGDPETGRGAVGEALDAVAALMAEGAYGDAAAVMDERVGAAIDEHVEPYEATLGEPTPGLLTDLVDEMVRRLEAVGGETELVLELPDGSTQCIEPVESDGSAAEYYGFDADGNNSSNTPDGLESDDATVAFVHRDATTGERSLVVLHGDPDATTGDGGTAVMTFGSVEGMSWQVQDGPPGNDAYGTPNDEFGTVESAAWSWPDDRSDGGVIGPLGDAPSVAVAHLAEETVNGETYQRSGVEQWLFVDGADVANPVEVANFVDEVDGDVGVRLYTGEC